ncbi:MAG: hypothetical protein ABI673_08775 [Novosphingobium sp.]
MIAMLSVGKRSFWNNVHPVGAIADLRAVYHQAGKYRWRFMLAAFACTGGIFFMMVQESWKLPPAKPKVVFINSWVGPRSDEEILASNIENQKRKDRDEADQKARDEKVKDMYRAVGRASGMDVEAIEKQARADEQAQAARAAAAEAAAAKAAAKAPAPAPSGTPVAKP